MIAAAKKGDTEIGQFLIAKGADVNGEQKGDETPLIQAAWNGHLEMVKLLVERGADVNKSTREGNFISAELRSPLMMARKVGNQEVIDYLIGHGAK